MSYMSNCVSNLLLFIKQEIHSYTYIIYAINNKVFETIYDREFENNTKIEEIAELGNFMYHNFFYLGPSVTDTYEITISKKKNKNKIK